MATFLTGLQIAKTMAYTIALDSRIAISIIFVTYSFGVFSYKAHCDTWISETRSYAIPTYIIIIFSFTHPSVKMH